MLTHTHSQTYTHTEAYTLIYTLSHKSTPTHTPSCTHTHPHTCPHTYTCAYAYSHILFIYTHAHTFTHHLYTFVVQSVICVQLFATPWTACSTPGFPVFHHFPELAQTQVYIPSKKIRNVKTFVYISSRARHQVQEKAKTKKQI